LAHLAPPLAPRAIGVLYRNPAGSFDTQVADQITQAKSKRGSRAQSAHQDIASLLRTGAQIIER
ncbi:MAG: hypothetical protein ACTSY1_09330, partial [Alphaproteobacteria bacterium]